MASKVVEPCISNTCVYLSSEHSSQNGQRRDNEEWSGGQGHVNRGERKLENISDEFRILEISLKRNRNLICSGSAIEITVINKTWNGQ